jgi:hypothetical protein
MSAERVARRFLANQEHQQLLHDFAKLFAGPRISDSRLCQQLGITLDEAHKLANEWRDILGITSMVSLRDALRHRH